MAKVLNVPLVGMAFRPPAKQILSILPLGTNLILVPEPTNQYDPNAIQVHVDLAIWPIAKMDLLQSILPDTILDAAHYCSQGYFHLGYLASSSNRKTNLGGPGNLEVTNLAITVGSFKNLTAELSALPTGTPAVKIATREPLEGGAPDYPTSFNPFDEPEFGAGG
jgi:hypothetical protein